MGTPGFRQAPERHNGTSELPPRRGGRGDRRRVTDEDESLLDSHEVSSVASLDRESVASTEGQRNRRPQQKRRPRGRYGGDQGPGGGATGGSSRSFSEPRDAGHMVPPQQQQQHRKAFPSQTAVASASAPAVETGSASPKGPPAKELSKDPAPPKERKSEPKEKGTSSVGNSAKLNGDVHSEEAGTPPAAAPKAQREPRQQPAAATTSTMPPSAGAPAVKASGALVSNSAASPPITATARDEQMVNGSK